MKSAHKLEEIKALKDKIATLEYENSSLKELISEIREEYHLPADQSNYHSVQDQVRKKFIENEGLFRNLFLETLDGIVFWGQYGKIFAANEATSQIFGLPLEELLQHNIDDFIYRKDKKYSEMKQKLRQDGALRDEAFILLPNGEKKLLEFTVKLNAGDGYHMTIVRDISERYRMEQQLRKSEERFRKIFEGSIEGMILWDDNCEYYDINPSGMLKLELEANDLYGRKLHDLFKQFGLDEAELKEKFRDLHRDGKLDGKVALQVGKDKKKHFEYTTKHHLVDSFNLTVFRNITEKIEMEEQLRKSDTLNILGELAAGIAHEIRNPMTALKGFIQLLESSIGDDYSLYFQVIKTELQRIDSIINEFLIVAKPQAIKYIQTDIAKIMQETVDLLTAQAVLYDVQFKTCFDEKMPEVYCDPNQLKKVFINLIKNAIEVMTDGGFVTVTISPSSDNQIHICIEDEGEGIPEEKVTKLGEPFYTTKEGGTGLGLMVSFKIIEEHGGKIEIKSEVGKGTAFNIYLPIKKQNEKFRV